MRLPGAQGSGSGGRADPGVHRVRAAGTLGTGAAGGSDGFLAHCLDAMVALISKRITFQLLFSLFKSLNLNLQTIFFKTLTE